VVRGHSRATTSRLGQISIPAQADWVKKVLNKLGDIGFGNHGTPTFINGQPTADSENADYDPKRLFSKQIQLNSQINWSDPNNTPDIEDGKPGTYRASDVMASRIDEKRLSPTQFMDLMVVHELEHYNGTDDPDNASVMKGLWHDCIKY
jgi:hypothetical protein